MAYAFVQKLSAKALASGSSVQSVAFTSQPAIGHLVVVPISTFTSTSIASHTISDTSGNTWAETGFMERLSSTGNYEHASVAWSILTATSASLKVTVGTGLAGSDIAFQAVEFSGNASSSPVDTSGTAGAGQGSTSITTAATATLAAAGELLVASFAAEGSLTNMGVSDPPTISGPTLSTAATSIDVSQDDTTIEGAEWAYAIASSTTAATAKWTYSSDSASFAQYVGTLVAFKVAAGGGPVFAKQLLASMGMGS